MTTTSPPGFDQPVPLPNSVERSRSRRTARLIRFSTVGIAVRGLVIALELVGFFLLGHAVLLVDALASLADVLASIGIIAAIKLAERPPDDDHPFGHGRYEPLAGLQLGMLICLGGGWMLFDQFRAAVTEPTAGYVSPYVALIPLVAALLLEGVYRGIAHVGRRERSTAMLAEAYHYRIDAITSLLAAAGLFIAALLPGFSDLIDHLSAMLLAAIMIGLGLLACWENLHELVGRVPPEDDFETVRRSAVQVGGVLDVEKVRIQTAGPDAHVDIDIEVDPDHTVQEAHRITQQVRAQIQTDWPAVREVVVHVEPYYEGDHE